MQEELLSGATTDPSALQQQVSRVDAEIRVVTQAATGSPGRTRDVEEIRRAFLDYVSEVSPTFTYGRAAIGPRTESTITALVRAVQVAHQREVVRSHQDLVESLDASRVARSILVALAILLGLLGVTVNLVLDTQ